MNKFLLSSLMVLSLCYSNSASAMIEHDENDLELSKRSFLISDAPYNGIDRDKGVLTLCFKKTEKLPFNWDNIFKRQTYVSFDHAALVFEFLTPKNPHEITASMVHYSQEDECLCFKEKEKVNIESTVNTLKKAYRAVKTSLTQLDEYVPATYTRFESWTLPNDKLVKGYQQAESDVDNLNGSYNCVEYVSKIMKIVGLQNVEFNTGLTKTSLTSSENLRFLVDFHIKPMPNYDENYTIYPNYRIDSEIIRMLIKNERKLYL